MSVAAGSGFAGAFLPRHARPWLIAVVLALGWHSVWWVWLQGLEVRARPLGSGVPAVHYRPVMSDAAGSADVSRNGVAAWAPTLFALPAPAGFSRPVLTNEIGVRPPLAMPAADARYLPRPPRAVSEPDLADVGPRMDVAVHTVLTSFPLRVQAKPVFERTVLTGAVVRTELAGGLEPGALRDAHLPEWPQSLRDRSWDVAAFVETDEEGRLGRVFLERRTPSEPFNNELVRVMRSWRVDGVEHPASGRIIIRTFVPVATPQAQEGRKP